MVERGKKMSNSSLAEKFIKATHFSSGRSGRKIETITIHHMAGVLTAEQCGRIFQGNRQASAHYGVGSDGRIAQYVDEAGKKSSVTCDCLKKQDLFEDYMRIVDATEKKQSDEMQNVDYYSNDKRWNRSR